VVGDDPLFAEVRAIVEKFASPRIPSQVGWDTRLTEDFWLDSVEMLEIVILCETTLGVAFDERSDFDGEALSTLGSLTALIRSKLDAQKQAQ
jgi:acyl carrier protein